MSRDLMLMNNVTNVSRVLRQLFSCSCNLMCSRICIEHGCCLWCKDLSLLNSRAPGKTLKTEGRVARVFADQTTVLSSVRMWNTLPRIFRRFFFSCCWWEKRIVDVYALKYQSVWSTPKIKWCLGSFMPSLIRELALKRQLCTGSRFKLEMALQ